MLRAGRRQRGQSVVRPSHPELGERYLYCEGDAPLLFTENETNTQRIFGVPNRTPYVKDGINNYVVHGEATRSTPSRRAPRPRPTIAHGGPRRPGDRCACDVARRRARAGGVRFGAFDDVFERAARRPTSSTQRSSRRVVERRRGQRHAARRWPGMLWTKQFYHYDVDKWLEGARQPTLQGAQRAAAQRPLAPHVQRRRHLDAGQVGVPLVRRLGPGLPRPRPDARRSRLRQAAARADAARAVHAPQRADPAYEWNFGDVNPPVHAWATIFTYAWTRRARAKATRTGSRACFQKLLLNFTWWVNRKDRTGATSSRAASWGWTTSACSTAARPLPTGGYLEQADGTAWMALFCQNMLEIAGELALTDPDYEDMALKFVEHFLWIASSMTHVGGDTGMWDEEDGFFYDVLRLPDGQAQRLKVRSMVGLLAPVCRHGLRREVLRSPEMASASGGSWRTAPS